MFEASRRWGVGVRTVAAGLIVAVLTVVVAVIVVTGRSASATPSPVDAFSVNRAVPNLRLLNEHGHTVSLTSFRGKYVVLTPFLTLCHEVCPLTTGAYLRWSTPFAQRASNT